MSTKKPGRPRNPEPLEQFTMRLTPRAKHRLKALSDLTGKPSYALLEAGFWQLLGELPQETRRGVETIAETVEMRGEGKPEEGLPKA